MKKQIILLAIATMYSGFSITWGYTGDVYTGDSHYISRVRHFEETEEETLFSTNGGPCSITASGTTLYWFDRLTHTINRIDTEGSMPAELLLTRSITPHKLKVDPVGQKLYWFEEQIIIRANLDGSDIETILTIDGFIEDFAFSPNADKLFWLDLVTGNVMSADMDGSNIQNITPNGLPEFDHWMAGGSSITASSEHVYFSCGGYGYGQTVYKTLHNGSTLESFIPSSAFIAGLYFHAKEGTLYWSFTPNIYGCYEIRSYCGPSTGVNDVTFVEGIDFFVSWGDDRPILWWSDSYGIHKKLLSYVKNLAVVTDNITGIESDFTDDEIGGWIYWAEMEELLIPEPPGFIPGGGNIYRVMVDGTSRETVLSGLNSVLGILFDPIHGHLYWADFLAETIYRTVPGNGTVEMVVENTGAPYDLAYDNANTTLYWSDYYTGIWSFNLATQSKTLIRALSEDTTPLALDTTTQTLYFPDYYNGLTKINTDGTEYESLGIHFDGQANILYDANDHALYWLRNELRYVNLAGTPVVEGTGVLGGDWLALDVRVPALTILGRPTVYEGSSVTLRTGVLPPLTGQVTYTWYKEGILIDGANLPVYAISAITSADAGIYYVVIKDELDRTYTSSPFTLTVLEGKLPLGHVAVLGVFLLVIVAFASIHRPQPLFRHKANNLV